MITTITPQPDPHMPSVVGRIHDLNEAQRVVERASLDTQALVKQLTEKNSMEVKIKTITFDLGNDKEIYLTFDEAVQLYEELHKLLGQLPPKKSYRSGSRNDGFEPA